MSTSKRSYYPALDGIRATAFLMVFFEHYALFHWGWVGVDVFFVLSGLLITGILLDSWDEPDRVTNFYIRRTLRIFPLYFGVMLAVVSAWPIFHWDWDWRWMMWPLFFGNYAVYLHPATAGSPLQLLGAAQVHSTTFPRVMLFFGHLWSLCAEEQFYLVWPWLVFWIRSRKTLAIFCGASVLILPIVRIVAAHLLPGWMVQYLVLYRATPFRMDALLLGALIAIMLRGSAARYLAPIARALLPALSIIAAVLAVHVYRTPNVRLDYVYPTWAFTWGLTLVDLLAACVIILALDSRSFVYRLFTIRPLRSIGRVSFGAYMFHDIFHAPLILATHFFTSRWIVASTLMGLPLTLLLAYASYYFFESHFIALKDRLSSPTEKPTNFVKPVRVLGQAA